MSYDSDPNSFEFLPGRLYYVPVQSTPAPHPQRHYFTIDHQLQYWNFFLDFGPLNLSQLYRFCTILNQKLSHTKLRDKVIYYYSSAHPHKKTNAAFLISAWSIICLDKTPEEAFRPFRNVAHTFPPWHDATQGHCTFNLTILDTLKGIYKAKQNQFFDFNTYAIDEFEHYERVENGDLNWCMEGKFIAFAGPQGQVGVASEHSHDTSQYQPLTPENYVEYFKFRNVTLVVRLNKKYYDARSFTNNGINHVDLYFLDGSNPPDSILDKFMKMSEDTPGAVAVHCKAGLGRTGSLISCYLMKHFKFTGEEVIGWLRICRPGSIIGPQQHWVKSMQQRMWREGDIYRTKLQELELAYKLGPLDHLQAQAEQDALETGRKSSRRGHKSSRSTGGQNSARSSRNSANLSLSSKMALLNVVNTYEATMHTSTPQSSRERDSFGSRPLSQRDKDVLQYSHHSSPSSRPGSSRATRPQSNKMSTVMLSPRSQALLAMSDSTQTFTSQQESENRSQADYLLARRLAKQQQQSDTKMTSIEINNKESNSKQKQTTFSLSGNTSASGTSSVDDNASKRKSRFGNFLSTFGTKR